MRATTPRSRPLRRAFRRPGLRIAALCTAAALTLGLPGCSAAATSTRPTVAVTTNILGDVVTELVGDQADVTVLMQPGADPHSFEVSARDAAGMRAADLLVSNGLGLEEGVQAHVDSAVADGTPLLEIGELIDPLVYDYEGSTGLRDPHFWTDPDRMIVAAKALGAKIEKIPGVDEAAVAKNLDAYAAQLEQLSAGMATAFDTIPEPQRALVTNHHVFGYLAERFGFRVVGAVIPSGTTLAAPSASDLASLAGAVRDTGVRAIFADSSQPDTLARVLAEEAGITVDVVPLFTESLTEPGGGADTYLQMMRANTDLRPTRPDTSSRTPTRPCSSPTVRATSRSSTPKR